MIKMRRVGSEAMIREHSRRRGSGGKVLLTEMVEEMLAEILGYVEGDIWQDFARDIDQLPRAILGRCRRRY